MDNEILNNIYETIQKIYLPLHITGVLLGLFLFGAGLVKWAHTVKYPGKVSKASIVGLLAGGLMLMNTNAILTILTHTLLGGSSLWLLTFEASVAPGPGETYMKAVVAAAKCIGAFGFLRGCYLLGSPNGESRSTVWAGLIHIIGGVLALNLEVFAIMLGDTFGGTFGETVKALFGQ